MECLIIVQNYPPEAGAVRYTFDLANELSEYGIEISVITEFPHYPSGQAYPGFEKNRLTVRNENGIEVIRVPVLRASNTQPFKRILGFITFFLSSLPHLIKKRNVDLIIVSIPSFISVFSGLLAKFLFRVPIVSILRDFEPFDSIKLRELDKNKIIYSAAKIISRLYRFMEALVIVYPDQLYILKEFGLDSGRIDLIPRPVPMAKFDVEPSREKYKLRGTGKNLSCIYAGTFGKRHALPRLIRSLISPPISGMPIDFNFIGNGEDIIECRKLAGSGKNNVRISETVSFNEIPAILMSADFLIYSENLDVKMDTLGAKFYEYLASERPIMVCGNSPASEIVKKIQNGWCVDSYDIDNLYECLKDILVVTSRLNQIGKRSRTFVNDNGGDNLFREKWVNLCNSLIKK